MRRASSKAIGLSAACVLASCGVAEPERGLDPLAGSPRFAVHRSDYESAAVALLDQDADLLDASYIASGTVAPGLSAPLHGDIALPTTPCHTGVLTILARYGGDYVLELDPSRGEVLRQVPTHAPSDSDEAAYRSNPQDILCDGHLAFVSRFDPNPSATEGDLDLGDDVAVLDLQRGVVRERIDLSQLYTEVPEREGEGEELAYARPGGLVRMGRFAVLGLGRFSARWVAGPGMVAVIDLEARVLHGQLELEGLRNCVELTPVAGRDDAVLVQCAGYPFGETATAGLALVALSEDGALTEEAALRDQEAPAIFASAVSLGGSRFVAAATGDYQEMIGDRVFVIDLATGQREPLFSTDTPGAVGSGAFDAESGLLLVPDTELGVRVFEVEADAVEPRDTIELDPALPARSVRAMP
jgi:hypothetical protein